MNAERKHGGAFKSFVRLPEVDCLGDVKCVVHLWMKLDDFVFGTRERIVWNTFDEWFIVILSNPRPFAEWGRNTSKTSTLIMLVINCNILLFYEQIKSQMYWRCKQTNWWDIARSASSTRTHKRTGIKQRQRRDNDTGIERKQQVETNRPTSEQKKQLKGKEIQRRIMLLRKETASSRVSNIPRIDAIRPTPPQMKWTRHTIWCMCFACDRNIGDKWMVCETQCQTLYWYKLGEWMKSQNARMYSLIHFLHARNYIAIDNGEINCPNMTKNQSYFPSRKQIVYFSSTRFYIDYQKM